MLQLGTMNVKELVQMFRNLGLINSLLTERAVVRIFCYVQEDEAADGEENDDTEMVYSEFIEALAAAAATLFPDPYLMLHQRVDIFIREKLFPAMTDWLSKQGKKL